MSRMLRKFMGRGESTRAREPAHVPEVTRPVTRGVARRLQEDHEEAEFDKVIYGRAFGYIHFVDKAHKGRFVGMIDRKMIPTRFIDRGILISLNLDDDIKRILKKSECKGLFKMAEHSYKGLTLEFLSSFTYSMGNISFRLFGIDYELTLAQLGKILGCSSEGETNPKGLRDGEAVLWKALTSRDDYGSTGYRFKANLIHHPVLRLWCRYISSIYFARPESNNLKACEITMLFSTLNLDSGKPFTVNVAHHIALHFESVASGFIHDIMIGGLITRLAKKLYPGFNESNWPKLKGCPPNAPLCHDEAYLVKLFYIEKVGDHWNWLLLRRQVLCRLPTEYGVEKPYKKVLVYTHQRRAIIDYTYYAFPHVQVQADRPEDRPTDRETEEAEPNDVPGVRLIPPPGDYERFMHYPFDMSTYRPSFLGSVPLPPTFAAPPPFANPAGWTQDARDAILWGAVNQQQQVNTNLLLGQHNLLSRRYDEGFFPENTVHPAHFTPQGPPAYQNWDRMLSDSHHARSVSFRRHDDNLSTQHTDDGASGSSHSNHRHSSFHGSGYSMWDRDGGY